MIRKHNSHPFGDLIRQHLSRKHGLSQNDLADGIGQKPSVITSMCQGKRLVGPKVRERVLAIILWFYSQGVLTTREEADTLLTAAGMASLDKKNPEEVKILELLIVTMVEQAQVPSDALSSIPTTDDDISSITTPREFVKSTPEGRERVSTKTGKLIRKYRLVSAIGFLIAILGIAIIYISRESGRMEYQTPTVPSHPANEPASATPFVVDVSNTIGPDQITPAGKPTDPIAPTSTDVGFISVCGETSNDVIHIPFDDQTQFLNDELVAFFDSIHTPKGVLYNFVRAVAVDARGLWFGYQDPSSEGVASGFGQYDGRDKWANCNPDGIMSNVDVNDVVIDRGNNVWVTTENAGILMFDGERWHAFTDKNVEEFESNKTFKITVDKDNNVWIGTWEGVAKYDGLSWSLPFSLYSPEKNILNNRVHAIAFGENGDIWVGHVSDGISHFDSQNNKWALLTTTNSKLGGNSIRDIIVQKISEGHELVWVATADGGVSKFENGDWVTYNTNNGILDNDVRDLALDRHNRVWIATAKGVMYFDQQVWMIYDTLDTLSIAFSPAECSKPVCTMDNDHIWTGTADLGLTHTRIPFNEQALAISPEVCFELTATSERTCVNLVEDKPDNTLIAVYPISLLPGTEFRFEITVIPLGGFELTENFGDRLTNTDADPINLFGAYPRIPVKGTVVAGQSYKFTDLENPFVAPSLESDVFEKTFASTWRIWMRRAVGPYIRFEFTVRK